MARLVVERVDETRAKIYMVTVSGGVEMVVPGQ